MSSSNSLLASGFDLDTALNSLYLLICTLLMLLVPLGASMFYSGLIQRRSSFTLLSMFLLIGAFITIDWYVWGYSLCYASASNRFIGSLNFVVLRHLKVPENLIYSTPRGDILAIIHFIFNGLMKVSCAALTFPACIAERGRIIPMFLFIFLWSAIIYNPVSYWIWNRNGWLSTQLDSVPVLDFAGGNCVHIVSGFTALGYSYYLGSRNPKILLNYKSSNNVHAVVGIYLLLCGWCGFLAGCDFSFTVTSIYLYCGTILCGSTAGIVWAGFDYYFSATPLEAEVSNEAIELQDMSPAHTFVSPCGTRELAAKRKPSMISFSSGLMAGLVVYTPAGGYITRSGTFWKCIIFGVIGGISGNLATRLKYYFKIDDALDIFAVHGVCGIVGSLLVGIFADDSYGSHGGWLVRNWVQLGYQVLGSVVTSSYVFIMSVVLLYLIDLIPGMHLRIDKHFNRRERNLHRGTQDAETNVARDDTSHHEKAELLGMDFTELNGEYAMDFMEYIKVIDPQDYVAESDSEAIATEHSGSQLN